MVGDLLNKKKEKFVVAIIMVTVFALCNFIFSYVRQCEQQINELNIQLKTTKDQLRDTQDKLYEKDTHIEKTEREMKRLQNEISRSHERSFSVVVTAYNLDMESCGKNQDDPAYGYTASGKNLRGHSLHSARAIAVDTNIIPMGSKVRIRFKNDAWKHLNGIYTAVDTGGAINGNRIDLFFGDYSSREEMMAFGKQDAIAEIL